MNTHNKTTTMETILCIPRMDSAIARQYIFKTLCKLKWGHVSILNEIPLRNEPTQKRILWRVRWDPCSTDATEYKKRMQSGESVKLVHDVDSPYFWKIVMSRM